MKIISLIFFFLYCLPTYSGDIIIEKRELKVKSFPCMNCHGNFAHDSIKLPLGMPHDGLVFKHMDSVTTCYQCHDQKNRNQLVLLNGEEITFNESHRQCFQCHGEKKRDWELGMHGKTLGSWRGTKYKSTCTECHDPHHPKFRQMKADPMPIHPHGKQAIKGGGHK